MHVYKRISELQVGDIVVTNGMRCLIDRPIEASKVHGLGSDGSQCRYTKALVLNRDEVNTQMVPWSFTADWDRNGKYLERPHHGEHRWSIQSNDLITWAVEQ